MSPEEVKYSDLDAIRAILIALEGLEQDERQGVIDFVVQKLRLKPVVALPSKPIIIREPNLADGQEELQDQVAEESVSQSVGGGLSQISGAGRMWMKRNQLSLESLSRLFSVDGDEIDLVADDIPGDNKKVKMLNVLLLKGVAGYLASGSARVKYEAFREACTHYDAWDPNNSATYIKQFRAEASGGRSSGLTLTPRGLNSATALVKQMIAAKKNI